MEDPTFWKNRSSYQELSPDVKSELEKYRFFCSALIGQLPIGLLFVGLDGVVLQMNEKAAAFLAVEHAELFLGKKFWAMCDDGYLGFSLRESLRFALPQKRLYQKLGQRDLEISTSFFFEGPSYGHGVFILLRDVTELQQLKEIAHRKDRMQELGEMAAHIAHDIRNPLGGIRGYASLLKRDLKEQKPLSEMAGLIIEAVKSLESFVTQLLHYAKPVQMEMRSIEMGAFLKKTAQFVRVDPAFPSNVHLEVHIPQDPILAPIDPDAIRSALFNLLYNGFQAMQDKGGILRISLLKPLEFLCQIDISDTGEGMSEEMLSQLFSPFVTTKKLGTGLGLVESRKFIKAHGGDLEVRSQKGRGSTFTIKLPLER